MKNEYRIKIKTHWHGVTTYHVQVKVKLRFLWIVFWMWKTVEWTYDPWSAERLLNRIQNIMETYHD